MEEAQTSIPFFLSSLTDRMVANGFESTDLIPEHDMAVCYQRHYDKEALRRDWIEDIYCPVTIKHEGLTPYFYEYYCAWAYNYIKAKTKKRSPFSPAIVIMSTIISSHVSSDLRSHLTRSRRPMHINTLEVPVVVNHGSGSIYFQERTPFYMRALYPYYWELAKHLFIPD